MIYYSINLVGWGMVNDIGILAEKMRWMGPTRYNVSSIIEIFRYSPRYAKIEMHMNAPKADNKELLKNIFFIIFFI